MEQPTNTQQISGFLLIDKPVDWTSHDIIAKLRHQLGIKKIGHAGTLDPFATGLLIVGVGRAATKHIDYFKQFEKTYTATGTLGSISDTQDLTGVLTEINTKKPENIELENTIQSFLGSQTQIPPMYSAKKINGKKLYELARKGQTIQRNPINIIIPQISLNNYKYPDFSITVTVSTGTYVRTLIHDIGQKLQTRAYCNALRRISIGNHDVKNAQNVLNINKKNIKKHLFFPPDIALT